MGKSFVWNYDSTQLCAKMWLDGVSAGRIAEHFNTTRGVIMGKLWREKLLGVERRKQTRDLRVLRPKEKAAVPPTFYPVLQQRELPPEPEPLHLELMELNPNNCRWPYGDDSYTFCGHTTHDVGVYCNYHRVVSTLDRTAYEYSRQLRSSRVPKALTSS